MIARLKNCFSKGDHEHFINELDALKHLSREVFIMQFEDTRCNFLTRVPTQSHNAANDESSFFIYLHVTLFLHKLMLRNIVPSSCIVFVIHVVRLSVGKMSGGSNATYTNDWGAREGGPPQGTRRPRPD